jgi:8-oxo-dGTP diphosphatase
MIVIETRRLLLRAMTLDDLDDLHSIFSDPIAMQHYPKPFDREMTTGWIEWSLRHYAKHGFGLLAVMHKADACLIGDCDQRQERDDLGRLFDDASRPTHRPREHPEMKPILGTMVYCLSDGQVLLMKRNKEPNLGLWVAPGGKVEPGESPCECALRELREETGLTASGLHFRGLVTEVSPRPDWQWLLFLYVAAEFSGEVGGDEREGAFRWWPVGDVLNLAIPQADRIFFPKVTDLGQPFYEAKCVYDAGLDLVEVMEYRS